MCYNCIFGLYYSKRSYPEKIKALRLLPFIILFYGENKENWKQEKQWLNEV